MRPRAAAMFALSAAVAFGIAALSRAPYSPPGGDAALLRISFRTTVSVRERCRPRTREELDALPVHMRTPEICTAEAATFFLIASIDDARADTLELVRGGVKGDRPLFVLDERPLPPGRHRVRVELLRAGADSGQRVLAALDTVLSLQAGAVGLVTLDGAGRLVARGPSEAR